MIMNEAEQG